MSCGDARLFSILKSVFVISCKFFIWYKLVLMIRSLLSKMIQNYTILRQVEAQILVCKELNENLKSVISEASLLDLDATKNINLDIINTVMMALF